MDTQPSQHYILNLSGYALFLYAAAVAIFYVVMMGNARMIEDRSGTGDTRKGWAAAIIVLVTSASNFIAAATVALLGKMLAIPTRHTMVAVPLLLLVERHLRLAIASPKGRRTQAFAVAGAAAGMAAGAAVFLGSDVAQKTIARALIPGDVVTMPVADALQDPSSWTISIQLVVFYCLSLAIFEGVYYLLKLASKSMAEGLRAGRSRETALAFSSAVALNFLGVAALVLLGRSVQVQIRQAMVLLPLFVITEAYVRVLRSGAVDRRSCLVRLTGSSLGLAGAGFLLLRHAPIH